MAKLPLCALKFTPFIIDLARGILLRDGEPQPLRRQSFEVLRYLAERQGTVVAGNDVIAALWTTPPSNPDGSLTQCIKDIRRALGPGHQWMVKTISGAGYTFVPEVVDVQIEAEPPPTPTLDNVPSPVRDEINDQSSVANAGLLPRPSGWWSLARSPRTLAALTVIAVVALWYRPRPPAPEPASSQVLSMLAMPSVALLPATGASDSASTLPQALIDEITAELRRSPRGYDLAIKTAAHNQVRDLSTQATAKVLDVRYVIATSLREEAGARQLVVQLIEGPTGRQIWAAPFIQPIEGLQAQNRVAVSIARALAVQIRTAESLRPLPSRHEAGHYVIQGRVLLESERDAEINGQAMTLYDKALALDPKHLQALMGYARTRVAAVGNGWIPSSKSPKYLADAKAAVDRAIALDQSTVGAHLLRGTIERTLGNFDNAVASFEHASSLNPNYPFVHGELGRTKLDMGRPLDAIAHIEQALLLSPTDPVASIWYFWAGMAAAQTGDFKASLDWMLKARQANSRYKNPRPWIAIAYAKLGDPAKARETIKEHLTDAPKFTVDVWTQLLARGNPNITKRLEPFGLLLHELGVPERT